MSYSVSEYFSNNGQIDKPTFRSIKRDNDRFFERARTLRQEMAEWSLSVAKEADEILERFPLEIKVSITCFIARTSTEHIYEKDSQFRPLTFLSICSIGILNRTLNNHPLISAKKPTR